MKVLIDVWSDFVCPFCYLEEPALDQLAESLGDQLTLRWRAFELRPDPVPTLDPQGEYLRDIWSRAVYPMAAERGMKLQLPPIQPRSRLAHEAVEFARANGSSKEMVHAIFHAFFEEGRDIGDMKILVELGEGIGLAARATEKALKSGTHRDQVLEDEALAHDLNIVSVPTLVLRLKGESLEDAIQLTGAQPFENLRAKVELLRGQPV